MKRNCLFALVFLSLLLINSCLSTSNSSDQKKPLTPAAQKNDTAVKISSDEQYLETYLKHLKYVVFVADETSLSQDQAKIAVTQANRYLIEKLGFSVVDYEQIEKNKKDQALAWQADTGGSISIGQYLARKFNADVYVEMDFKLAQSSSPGKYNSSVSGTMKIYDPSTGTMLGSVTYSSPEGFSPNSIEAAISNVLAASTWTMMPRVTSQAHDLLANSLARGVRFELTINHTGDSKAVSALRKALAKKVREVELVSWTTEESRLDVFAFVSSGTLQDLVLDAAQIAGIPDMAPLSVRGKSLSFDAGQ